MDSNLNHNFVNEDSIPYEMTVAEKIKMIVDRLCGGEQKTFQERCGVSEATPSNWKKRNSMKYQIVSKAFPEISLMWLINGEGPMLLSELENENHPDSVPTQSPSPESRPYSDAEPSPCYKVAEGEPVDRAFVNVLLQQVSTLTQQVAMLQAQNLQLNIDKATLEERMRGAANWFHDAVAKHPDLKPAENKKG